MKSAIVNSDNHVVKRTITSMPGGALPSGTDWNLFLTRLIYNLYTEKEKTKFKKTDTGDDDDSNQVGIGKIGGSSQKEYFLVNTIPYEITQSTEMRSMNQI